MRIIVEGPDNAGKTTLVKFLSSRLGIPIVPGRGPAISQEEINDRVREFHSIDHGIFDRHPCVSQLIYNQFRKAHNIDQTLVDEFCADERNVFVFCRGRPTLTGHELNEKDQRVDLDGIKHEDLVKVNHAKICEAYNKWALVFAHVIYRIGDSMPLIARLLNTFDPVADIEDFHRKFELTYDGKPRSLPKDLLEFRHKFMLEEVDEYRSFAFEAYAEAASGEPDVHHYTHCLEYALDGLVDGVYVTLGTSYLHGFDFKEAWRRVHDANMKKVRALRVEDSKRSSTYDVVKPQGWTPPSHHDLVKENDVSTKVDKSIVDPVT
jgi:predicted HAD superfamily Cof-like phosphohydrolase